MNIIVGCYYSIIENTEYEEKIYSVCGGKGGGD